MLRASSRRSASTERRDGIDYKEAVEEWWLIILTFPILFAFIPGCTEQVARGFQALHLAPRWFQEAVGAAILFAFGRRTLSGLRMPSFNRPRGDDGKRTNPATSTSPVQPPKALGS